MKEMMFSNEALRKMIVPLFLEQFFVMLVGLADTFVVSFAGEAAVSGVSLVNSFNTIFIFLFTALASGGAVIVSQYIGRKQLDRAREGISQLLTISVLFSVFVSIVILVSKEALLSMMFGSLEPSVMEACIVYLRISLYAYPLLAVYNAGTALYRSIGKTKETMVISIISNVINIIGNLIGVFVLHAGVAGVAYPSLIARFFSAAAMTLICFREQEGMKYELRYMIEWNASMLKKILKIAVPNGVESGVFQFVKVALSSMAALFGTHQIAANGIAQSIWSIAALVSVAMGPVFITVIGQCMGLGDTDQAQYYFKKLLKITIVFSLVWNMAVFAATPFAVWIFAVDEQTKWLVIALVLIHNLFNSLAYPFADPLGKGLRATGDVNFTTVVSLLTTIGIRLLFSVFFAVWMHLGVIGIAYAMCLDWSLWGVIFWLRTKSNVWKKIRLI